METILIKYFAPDLPELNFIGGGKSDWMDLYAAEEVEFKAGEYKRIPLGVAIALPLGFEAHMVPRSSTFEKYGLLQANSMGIIDFAYRGNQDQWRFPAYATRDVIIPRGARICQFRLFEHQPPVRFVTVENLPDPDRGGFGSTGI